MYVLASGRVRPLVAAIAGMCVAGSASAVSFVDPTAVLENPGAITISEFEVFVAPFAQLRAGSGVG
jgi:hypothetical protein